MLGTAAGCTSNCLPSLFGCASHHPPPFHLGLHTGGCIDWWLDDMAAAIPYIVNGMADAGALLCLHDSYGSTCEGVPRLVAALTSDNGGFTNPQVGAVREGEGGGVLERCSE
jgi:hypothetical protein